MLAVFVAAQTLFLVLGIINGKTELGNCKIYLFLPHSNNKLWNKIYIMEFHHLVHFSKASGLFSAFTNKFVTNIFAFFAANSNLVKDPIKHPVAQYIITEQIFGKISQRTMKAMNQLLHQHGKL